MSIALVIVLNILCIGIMAMGFHIQKSDFILSKDSHINQVITIISNQFVGASYVLIGFIGLLFINGRFI